MSEAVIKIPDLRVVFNDDTGAILFPNIKEIKLSRLIDVYFALENSLLNNDQVLKTKSGNILGAK